MPEELDPNWEYWQPPLEVLEALGAEAGGFESLPWREDCSGRAVPDGFRLGAGRKAIDFVPFRLAPPKGADRPDRLPLRECRGCGVRFTPGRRHQRYCSPGCSNRGRRVYFPRPCRVCGREFTPTYREQVACSARCGGVVSGAKRRGRPQSHPAHRRAALDWDRVCELHLAGHSPAAVARLVGASKASVTHALKCRGVFRPRKAGRPRVLPDRQCKGCGAAFRPRQERSWVYCSLACRDRHCNRTPLDKARVLELHAAGWNNCRIAREVGGSESGVRGVIRRHHKREGEAVRVSHKRLRELGVEVPPKPTGGRAATGDGPGAVAGSLVLAYCRAKGYPEPVAEHEFHPGRGWRFDYAWPTERVALEIEGVTREGGRHQRVDGYAADCVKYSTASLSGWRLIRCTPAMVRDGRAYGFLDLAFGGRS